MAVFLNPYVRHRAFNRAAISSAALYNMAKRVFARVFRQDPDLEFVRALIDYVNGAREFSDAMMGLADYQKMAEQDHVVSVKFTSGSK